LLRIRFNAVGPATERRSDRAKGRLTTNLRRNATFAP